MLSRAIAPIYYHKTDDSRLELDFVIQYQGKLLPIEVKAEGNVRANSLTNQRNLTLTLSPSFAIIGNHHFVSKLFQSTLDKRIAGAKVRLFIEMEKEKPLEYSKEKLEKY